MARASSVVSARAMALASITQHKNRTKVADFCSAPVAGFYAAIDSSISDHGAKALVLEISAALANRNAMLIVVPNIDLIPMSLRKALSKPIRIAPISKDVLLFGISLVHPTSTRAALQEIADILPSDLSLKAAGTYPILAAFRQPNAVAIVKSLNAMLTSAQPQTGIEALRGSGELMVAAEQIVADMQAYGRGELQWKDIPRGLLLCGQPGTGKTFAASCIAASAQVAFIATTSGRWQAAGHLGNMLKEMRDDFARARALAPSILFIDEVDSLGSRQSADSHGQSYRRQVIAEFLAQVDGVEAAEGVMLIGATNHVEALDPALLRPGRLDRLIVVPLPDQKTLEQLLRHHLQTDLPDLNLTALARMARGNTPADIAGAVRLARARARAEKTKLSEAHLIHLLDRDYDLLPEKEWIVSVHEAGHALTCHLLNLGKVEEMRLDRAGGLTRVYMSPITGTLQTIQNLMVYHLAGRAAELVVLNEVTAGSGGNEESDLAKATGLALQIERALGLGANGLVWEAASHPAQSRPMSTTERNILNGHLTAAHSHAESLLRANVKSLVKLAKRLATDRCLTAEEINGMLPVSEGRSNPNERPHQSLDSIRAD